MISPASRGSKISSRIAALSRCQGVGGEGRYGTSGTEIGNAHLKWAFSEAAVLFLRANPAGQKSLTQREKKHGSGKALPLLGQKLGRTVYYMLQRQTAFDMDKFLNGLRERSG